MRVFWTIIFILNVVFAIANSVFFFTSGGLVSLFVAIGNIVAAAIAGFILTDR